jgi:hypothetical protein
MRAFAKIDKKERDAVKEVCLMSMVKVDFFTVEENELLTLAVFDVPDPAILFVVGRMVEVRLEMEIIKNKIA